MNSLEINNKPSKVIQIGNSYYFRIKISKIQENIIEPDKEYKVTAIPITGA